MAAAAPLSLNGRGKKTCFREISLIIGKSSRVSAWFVYCSEKNSALKLFPLMDKVGHPLWVERRLLDKNKGTCNVKFKRTYWNEKQNKTRANVYFLHLLLFLENIYTRIRSTVLILAASGSRTWTCSGFICGFDHLTSSNRKHGKTGSDSNILCKMYNYR